jgi:hypothetical protein
VNQDVFGDCDDDGSDDSGVDGDDRAIAHGYGCRSMPLNADKRGRQVLKNLSPLFVKTQQHSE